MDESGSLATQLSRIVDGLGRLLSQHLALAKLELSEEARALGGSLARIAAFLPFVLVGYALLCVALSLWLGRWLGREGGWAVIGGLNLVGGALGVWLAARSLRARPGVLTATRNELRTSADALALRPSGSAEVRHGR